MKSGRYYLTLLLGLLAACGGGATTLTDAEPGRGGSSGGPSGQPPTGPAPATAPEDSLHFLRLDVAAPALAQVSVSFYAVRGEDREASIWYHPRAGQADSTRLARFRVRKESLVNDAQGVPLAEGDSILITMTAADTSRQLVDLQPSGLTFDPDDPARLTLFFAEADHDFNDDGHDDSADVELENQFQIWGQEHPGDPFVSLPTELGHDEVEAKIPGFTRYVVAY